MIAAPRIIWGTSLVLMLAFIFICQGGFVFGSSDSEKVLSVHYICMSIAWPVRPCRTPCSPRAQHQGRSRLLTIPGCLGLCRS